MKDATSRVSIMSNMSETPGGVKKPKKTSVFCVLWALSDNRKEKLGKTKSLDF